MSALVVLAIVYAMLVVLLVGLAGPLRLVFERHDVAIPEACRQTIAAGSWLATPIGAVVALGALAALLSLCGWVVPAPRRSRVTWTTSVLLMVASGVVLVAIWLPIAKLSAALGAAASR